MIASILNSKGDFSFAQSFVQLNTVAAAPNFELRFNAAQNPALDRLNAALPSGPRSAGHNARAAHNTPSAIASARFSTGTDSGAREPT